MSVGNLLDLLQQAAKNGQGKGVLVFHYGNGSSSSFLTYEKLLALAEQRSMQLQQLEDIHDRVVLMYCADHLDSITWFWAIIAAGGVPCICPPLSKDSNRRQEYITYLRELLGGPLIITTMALISEFQGLKGLRILLTSDIESLMVEKPKLGLHFQRITKTERDLAVLMLTSGSTGKPKAVCLEHKQILVSLRGKSVHHGTTHNDVFLNWIGLDHVANLTQIHLHAISLTAQQVHVPGTELLANPLSFLEHISNHNITHTFAPNFFLATLVRSLESLGCPSAPISTSSLSSLSAELGDPSHKAKSSRPTFELSSLRALFSGGESNVVDTCDKLTRILLHYGAPKTFISPGFGMTETCAGSIHNAVNCPSYDIAQGVEFCSVGDPIPGIEMRIVRHDGTDVGRNDVGSLEVSGPVVFSGYYNDMKASHAAFTPDGWFKTGDVGFLDSNGRLRLTGRDKDIVVINGINHSCQGIETAIEQTAIPEITPSFTVVWPYRSENSPTETLCVAYLPSYSSDDTRNRARTAVAISKAVVKYCGARPFKIIALPESSLQKSSLGKLPRLKIRQAFEHGIYRKYEDEDNEIMETSRKNIGEVARTPTERIILQIFHDLLAADYGQLGIEIRIDSDMFEIGMSSIDLLKLRVYLQTALKVEIPMTIFFSHPVLQDLSQAIDDLQNNKEYDPITVLQPNGTRIPVFLIHPGLGEILIFMNLARYIEDRPVYALRARGFDSEGHFSSMEEIITVYHDAIKRVQPTGPYALVGHSFGSILAFEITKLMEASNDTVQFLASIDQPPYFKWWARLTDWYYAVLTISFYMGLIEEDYKDGALPDLQKKTHGQVLDHIIELAGPARLNEVGMSRERLDNWATLAHELKVIARDYDPTGRVASMDIFHTDPLMLVKPDQEWPHDDILKWAEFSEDIKFHVVPGTHSTLIRSPHVRGLHKILKKAMEERGL